MIKDKNIDPDSNFTFLDIALGGWGSMASTQTATVHKAWRAPWAGKIVGASCFATALAATTNGVDIFKGTTTMLSAVCVPVANTSTDMFSSFTTKTFSAGDVLSLRLSGTITNAEVHLSVRPLVAKEISGY